MIELAWISLAALVLVVVLSCTTAVNPGFASLVFAWLIGIYVAPHYGRHFTIGEVIGGFPSDLFLTLVGVTLLFALARANGTLDQVVRAAMMACREKVSVIPIVFFGLALGIASIGAGNIAAAVLVAPLAMAVATRAKISPLMMTLMVGHGCIAGALSPIAPSGIIANGLMSRMGMSGFERQNYLYNLVANSLAASAAYLAFGGLRLWRHEPERVPSVEQSITPGVSMTLNHWITLGAIATLVAGVIAFRLHVGLGAFARRYCSRLGRSLTRNPSSRQSRGG